MWYTVLFSFLQKNYKALGVVAALGLVGYGVSYVKDVIHAKAIAAMDTHIKQLTAERDALLVKKDEQAKETARALENFATAKETARVAQAKVDQLIYERNHPTTTTKVKFDTIADCEQTLIAVREKADEDAGIYIAEIEKDRSVIALADVVIADQKAELITANTVIAKDTGLIDELKVRVATADDDLKKSDKKVKFWRTTTAGSVLVIIGLILL
jgi:vacuolar-type H+-ATPase subunit I/STV1